MKQTLLKILDSLKRGLEPFTVSHTEWDDNGCEYGVLTKHEDGRLYLADCNNGPDMNPKLLDVASLPETHIRRICNDTLKAKLISLDDDFERCCNEGLVIEWADDAHNAICDAIMLMETSVKIPKRQ